MGAHVSTPLYQRTVASRYRLDGSVCDSCGFVHFPPRQVCRECLGRSLSRTQLSGLGRVVAVTRVHASAAPPELRANAAESPPYWTAVVSLDEGPLIPTELVC